jgi:hypothetical protein
MRLIKSGKERLFRKLAYRKKNENLGQPGLDTFFAQKIRDVYREEVLILV